MVLRIVGLAFATALAARSVPAQPQAPVTIFVTGDIMPARGATPALMGHRTNLNLLEPLSRSADLAFANLEGAAYAGEAKPRRNQLLFDPPLLQFMRGAGFDVLSVANNHALDGGEEGLAEVRRLWNFFGGSLVGTGEPVRSTVNGRTVTWLAATGWGPFQSRGARIQHLEPVELAGQVRALSGKGEAVFISLHWGQEYKTEPTAQQRAVAHALIDAGAMAVIGHHTHVAGPVETYKGRPIFYSLGNFVFDRTPWRQSGLAGFIRLEGKRVLARSVAVQPDATVSGPKLPAGEVLHQALPGHFLSDSAPQQVLWSKDGKGVHHLRLFVWDGNSWQIRASGTHPAIEALRTGDLDGDGVDEVWLQLRQRSKLDITQQKRLHIYRAVDGRGFRPVWRGSGLSRPFRQWAPLYRQGSWATDLVALETDTRPDFAEFSWLAVYRWNGFGFRRIWDHPVRGEVRLEAADVPLAAVPFSVRSGGQERRYMLWSAPNGAILVEVPAQPASVATKAE